MFNTDTTPRYPLSTPKAVPFIKRVSAGTKFTVPSDIYYYYSIPNDHSGSGTTIAVIDAYGDKELINDFVIFGELFGLPKNNLEVYGVADYKSPEWSLEARADTQWAYSASPYSRIICVLANNDSIEALFKATNTAIENGADIISMSFGSDEFFQQARYSEYMRSTGKIFIASAGDTGGKVVFPSSSDMVISVGGTAIYTLSDGEIFKRIAWKNTGGGPSRFTPIPSWQKKFSGISQLSGGMRATPDVALDASENPGYCIYSSFDGGLTSIGGTSISAPIFAGICGRLISGEGGTASTEALARFLYRKAGGSFYHIPQYYFNDITVGSNERYGAKIGYDFCTGLGSPILSALC